MITGKGYILNNTGKFIYKLQTCTKISVRQSQAKSSRETGVGYTVSPKAMGLLAFFSSWEKERPFSVRELSLVSHHTLE